MTWALAEKPYDEEDSGENWYFETKEDAERARRSIIDSGYFSEGSLDLFELDVVPKGGSLVPKYFHGCWLTIDAVTDELLGRKYSSYVDTWVAKVGADEPTEIQIHLQSKTQPHSQCATAHKGACYAPGVKYEIYIKASSEEKLKTEVELFLREKKYLKGEIINNMVVI